MTGHRDGSGADELWRAMGEAHAMPYGAGQIAAAEQIIRRADATGDAHLRFAARMLGTVAYVWGGERGKSFVTFSWCLADFDRSPSAYHEHYTHSLMWHFKTMIGSLVSFPDVPLDRTCTVLDDMERRFREAGHSLAAVHKSRHMVARCVGDTAAAEHWYRRWVTAPRDDLSDCAGCDPSTQVAYLAEQGRDEEAVALAEPVLAGQLGCSEQPQGVLTALLVPYVRTGRLEQAAEAHRRAYRRLRVNLADLADIAEHIAFCARTGNEVRGLEILERHLHWLDRAPTPDAAMEFAAAGALVLRRLAAAHSELRVRRPAFGERAVAEVGVAELAAELAAMATGLAARFDARNGTAHRSAVVAGVLAAEPLVEHLPLSATVQRRVVAPVPIGSAVATAAGARSHPDDHPGVDAVRARVEQAREAAAAGTFGDAVTHYVEAVALCAEQGRTAQGAHLRLDLAEAYRGAHRWLAAAEAGEEALPLLQRHGADADVLRCRLLLSEVYRNLDEIDAALGQLDEVVAAVAVTGDLVRLARAHETAGELLYHRNDDAAGALRFTMAAAAFQRADLRVDELRALRRAVVAWRWADEPESVLATIADADRVADALPPDVAAEPAARWEVAYLGHEAARSLLDMDRPVEALLRIVEVPGILRSIEAFGEAVESELLYTDILLDLDRPEDAEPMLRAAIAGLPRDADDRYLAAWRLVRALAALGRDVDAAAVRVEYGFDEDDC
ncbi:hypothetical protein [Pseudonocardia sp. GCM10023141]|uniref:hypothetical protein n=1 Tax=Pseudonocardia sp. GCM10023141 TaxID=3252653 RepID=UPI0036196C70